MSVAVAEHHTAPTLADAAAVARLLAQGIGVSQVCVFGSVARGTADADSDIDLLVVYDDIDYGEERLRSEAAMSQIAFGAVGCDVDVRVTDWAQWNARRAVTSSFEATISHDLVVLEEVTPPSNGRTDKVITMASVAELAAAEIDVMGTSISFLSKGAFDLESEQDAIAEGAPEADVESFRIARWRGMLQHAHMAIEHASTALVHATGGRNPGKKAHHRIELIIAHVADEQLREELSTVMAPLHVDNIPLGELRQNRALVNGSHINYRIVSDYYGHDAEIEARVFTADLVDGYVRACRRIAERAVHISGELPVPEHAAGQCKRKISVGRKKLAEMTRWVDGYDAYTGSVKPSVPGEGIHNAPAAPAGSSSSPASEVHDVTEFLQSIGVDIASDTDPVKAVSEAAQAAAETLPHQSPILKPHIKKAPRADKKLTYEQAALRLHTTAKYVQEVASEAGLTR